MDGSALNPTGPTIVERVHVLETIEGMFSEEVPLVFVEGESGCGATVLLRQFAQHHAQTTFTLFIKPASRFAYNADYLRLLLTEQFADHLGLPRAHDNAVDESEFSSLMLAVRKRKGKGIVYFVVDGLQQIPDVDRSVIEHVFHSILPIGWPGFRFLVTGPQERFGTLVGPAKSKAYTVQRLSRTESLQLLQDLKVSQPLKDELVALCKGLPGRLMSVRSIVGDDESAEKLLRAGLADYPDFIAFEMRPLNQFNDLQMLIVALVAHTKYAVSASHLRTLSGASDDDLANISESCGFISFSNSEPFCEFASETYRRYAERLTESFRSRAISLQIEYLAANKDSRDAVQFLPAYYQSLNQQQAILDMLDGDHYAQLLDATGSYSSLQARAAMGARSASELNEAVGIFQFALQRSIFASISSSRDFKSQVGALVALNRADEALSLAMQAPTVELRVKMMSEYARHLSETGIAIDPEILQAIRESVSAIACNLSENEIEDLAEDIVHFDVDLTLELLDELEARDPDGKDDAILKLAIRTSGRPGARSEFAERTSKKVSSERHRDLIGFIVSYAGGPSSSDIKRIADNLGADRRIYFLRCVLAGPVLGADALKLVGYALDSIVTSTSYLPKVRDLADIATPLEYAAGERSELETIIGRLEAQLGLAERSSASVPLIDLKMKLAIADSKVDITRSRDRLLEAYVEVCSITLPDARAESLALMLRALRKIDLDGVLDQEEGLSPALREELLATLKELLSRTANHFEVARSALSVITTYDPQSALRLAADLNTFAARDSAYEAISVTLATGEATPDNVDALNIAFSAISEEWRAKNAIIAILQSAVRTNHRGGWANVVREIVVALPPSANAAEALVLLCEMYVKDTRCPPVEVIDRLTTVEGQVSSAGLRCEILYRAASLIARQSVEIATDIYERAEATRANYNFISDAGVQTIRICLSLLLRAARPLIAFDLFDRSLLARFAMLADYIPDSCGRVSYMADLATKAACEGKLDLATEINNTYCIPLLEAPLSDDDRRFIGSVIFVPVFMIRGAIALKYLDGLETIARDQALMETCFILISGVTAADAQPVEMSHATIDYACAENVLSLVAEMRTDAIIATVVRALVDAALSKSSRRKFAGHQSTALKADIIRIANLKLPQPDSVAHEGYRIEVEAYACRLADTPTDVWQRLADEAERIPNLADRVLVKSEIASALPARLSGLAKKMLRECQSDVRDIPSAYDRYGRMEALIRAARGVDGGIARAAVRDSLEISFEIDDPVAAAKSRRKLLDLAEQVDPKGLDDLVNSIDDDVARAAAKAELKEQVEAQKFRRKLGDPRITINDPEIGGDTLPSAAHQNLVSLVAGRAEPSLPDQLTRYVAASGGWDLVRAFPVLAWYLETLARRVRRQEDAMAKCAPPLEALLLSTELATKFLSRSRSVRTGRASAATALTGVLVAREDAGRAGIEFMRDWLRACASDSKEVIVSDPYFRPQDVDLIRLIFSEAPTARVTIVTSRSELMKVADGAFEEEWWRTMDQDPPEVEIIGISDFESSKAPIHDRWILSGDRGLRMGTSFGGLGARWSEISIIADDLVEEMVELMTDYASKRREVAGRKVSYLTVTL